MGDASLADEGSFRGMFHRKFIHRKVDESESYADLCAENWEKQLERRSQLDEFLQT